MLKSCLPQSSQGLVLFSDCAGHHSRSFSPALGSSVAGHGGGISCSEHCVRGGGVQAGRNLVDSLILTKSHTQWRWKFTMGAMFPASGQWPRGTRTEWCCWEVGNALPFPLFSEILLKEVSVCEKKQRASEPHQRRDLRDICPNLPIWENHVNALDLHFHNL